MAGIKKFNFNLNHLQKEKLKNQEKNKQRRINIINQIIYDAPKLIKKKSKQIIETADYRINNLSNEQQIVKSLIRKIIKETTEAMYQVSFDLLSKFGIEQF